jgi:hypothetical protein
MRTETFLGFEVSIRRHTFAPAIPLILVGIRMLPYQKIKKTQGSPALRELTRVKSRFIRQSFWRGGGFDPFTGFKTICNLYYIFDPSPHEMTILTAGIPNSGTGDLGAIEHHIYFYMFSITF